MSEGVIAHDVSRFDDFAGNIGPLLHVASDQKKSRANVVLRQDFQQAQRVRIVGPVVIGERELLS